MKGRRGGGRGEMGATVEIVGQWTEAREEGRGNAGTGYQMTIIRISMMNGGCDGSAIKRGNVACWMTAVVEWHLPMTKGVTSRTCTPFFCIRVIIHTASHC